MSVQAAVAMVLSKASNSALNSFLLNQYGDGSWSLPGGTLEAGESAVDGAVRAVGAITGLPPRALHVHPFPVLATDATSGTGKSYLVAHYFAWVERDFQARSRTRDFVQHTCHTRPHSLLPFFRALISCALVSELVFSYVSPTLFRKRRRLANGGKGLPASGSPSKR